MALQDLADRTDREFGIRVDRIWCTEPKLSDDMQALSDAHPDSNADSQTP
jgi:hypothetical protein